MQDNQRVRVLQDLSMGMLGYSGIPQDARLMFKTFSQLPGVDVTGLLAEMGPGFTRRTRTSKFDARQAEVFNGSIFLLGVSGIQTDRAHTRLARLKRRLQIMREPLQRYGVSPLHYHSLDDAIWRLYFEKTLDAADRPHILRQKFALTNLNFVTYLQRLQARMFFAPRLDTQGYDFLVTSEPRPIKLTQKVSSTCGFN